MGVKVLLIDNFDSFTYNLVHLLEKVDKQVEVVVYKNNQISLNEANLFDKIVLSPGPGLPKDAGNMPLIINHFYKTKSILGVCLGMQAIGEAFGGALINLETVFHGIATPIIANTNTKLFSNCPKTFNVGRYHSWVVSNTQLPEELEVIAKDENGSIMALQHKAYNVCGVQFHPESILSEYGEQLIKNWITLY